MILLQIHYDPDNPCYHCVQSCFKTGIFTFNYTGAETYLFVHSCKLATWPVELSYTSALIFFLFLVFLVTKKLETKTTVFCTTVR